MLSILENHLNWLIGVWCSGELWRTHAQLIGRFDSGSATLWALSIADLAQYPDRTVYRRAIIDTGASQHLLTRGNRAQRFLGALHCFGCFVIPLLPFGLVVSRATLVRLLRSCCGSDLVELFLIWPLVFVLSRHQAGSQEALLGSIRFPRRSCPWRRHRASYASTRVGWRTLFMTCRMSLMVPNWVGTMMQRRRQLSQNSLTVPIWLPL